MNAIRSEPRCTTSRDESQMGFGRCDTLRVSTFCPAVLDGIVVTVEELATLDCVPVELAASLLDRRF